MVSDLTIRSNLVQQPLPRLLRLRLDGWGDEMSRKHKSEVKAQRRQTDNSGSAEATERFPGEATAVADHPVNAEAALSTDNQSGDDAMAKLQAENADLKDRLLRALAEVENVRRRAEKDVSDTRQYAVAKFAGDILSVADNMERAIASIPTQVRKGQGAIKTLVEGIELTEREMLNVLEKHGIRKLIPVGERFDPNFHEALFEVPDATVPHGTVSRVVEPGYSIGSRPLRPAKVATTRGGPLGTDKQG
ncbi:nucleotide exchange factor GrpE [Mesorhizobium sp. CCNWLW179-1]|uniref:nucleotide exchange factor GrpE n=1 Tax=unclassified Mesorhizobium TaxID=325217 RepID=UPI0030147985